MKKYIMFALIACSIVTSSFAYDVTPEMKNFGTAYKQTLTEKLGTDKVFVTFSSGQNGINTIIKIDHPLSLRQSRIVLIDAVEAYEEVIKKHPELRAQLFGDQFDYRKINLAIDNYDDKKDPKEQFGVSTIILTNGIVHFMGISHKTGKEILRHKQPYHQAIETAQHQGLK